LSNSPATNLLKPVKLQLQDVDYKRFTGGEGRNWTGLGALRLFQLRSATSSPPEAYSLKHIEHPYIQAFPPICQGQSVRTHKPSITQQLLSKNSFTGTFTGCDMRLLEQLFVMDGSRLDSMPQTRAQVAPAGNVGPVGLRTTEGCRHSVELAGALGRIAGRKPPLTWIGWKRARGRQIYTENNCRLGNDSHPPMAVITR
jgi:hypothetical protein